MTMSKALPMWVREETYVTYVDGVSTRVVKGIAVSMTGKHWHDFRRGWTIADFEAKVAETNASGIGTIDLTICNPFIEKHRVDTRWMF